MERDLLALAPATRWVGARLDVYREVDSTNLVAERLAAAGAPEGTLVVADAQTAGRGRLGRTFFSPGGRSLYLSLVLRPEAAADRLHRLVFAAALAVAETARAALPAGVQIEIKWPNDVLLDGLKTSGINLPARLDGARVVFAVLGIGLNVNLQRDELPAELRGIATSLRAAGGRPLDRVAVAEDLLVRLEVQLERLREAGFACVLEDWRRYFRMRGERVRVGGPGIPSPVEGVAEDVDPEGALLLRCGAERRRILAGDVTLLRRER